MLVCWDLHEHDTDTDRQVEAAPRPLQLQLQLQREAVLQVSRSCLSASCHLLRPVVSRSTVWVAATASQRKRPFGVGWRLLCSSSKLGMRL